MGKGTRLGRRLTPDDGRGGVRKFKDAAPPDDKLKAPAQKWRRAEKRWAQKQRRKRR